MRTRAISLSFIAVLALVATALLLRAERTTTPRATPTAGASQDADRGETTTATGELPRRFQGAPAREQGAVERVDYQTRYDDRSIDKQALVYLPAATTSKIPAGDTTSCT